MEGGVDHWKEGWTIGRRGGTLEGGVGEERRETGRGEGVRVIVGYPTSLVRCYHYLFFSGDPGPSCYDVVECYQVRALSIAMAISCILQLVEPLLRTRGTPPQDTWHTSSGHVAHLLRTRRTPPQNTWYTCVVGTERYRQMTFSPLL